MRYLLIVLLVASFTGSAFCQSSGTYTEEAKKLTTPLVSRYKLNKEQQAKMVKIQERKLSNTAEIQTYRNNDEMMYYRKKKSIQNGTDFSITKLLNEDQLKIYKKDKAELRTRRANASKQLREKGVGGFELEKALIDIE